MEGTGEPELTGGLSTAANTEAIAEANVASSVVAVVVTRNPGPALDDTLASLLAQDHRNLSVLVIDDGSDEAVFDRVAAVAPSAFVRRFESPLGFGAAANVVTEMVQGASHYLFCHDDIALAPDAVRLLTSAAISSAAVIAAPKLVSWNNHERFLSLGYAIDRSGSPVALVELDELDQGQHDQQSDVTAVHGAALLVAATTFSSLGGFIPSLTDPAAGTTSGSGVAAGPDVGEDIDLCLRARRSGGRIIIVPSARVAHQSIVHGVAPPVECPAPGRGPVDGVELAPVAEQRVLRDRNRIRSMVANADGTQLVILLPLLLLQALRRGAPPAAATSGPRSRFTALRLALGQRSLRKDARALAHRTTTADLGHELVPVTRRFRAGIRSDVNADTARLWRVAERALGSRRGGRLAVGTFVAVCTLVLFGSRGLLGSGVGRSGRFVALPPVGDLWRLSFSGWHEPGLGHFGAVDPGIVLLALASTLLLGATGLVGTLLAVAPLAIGATGMWRCVRHGSTAHGRVEVAIAGSVTYLLVPIPFDALSSGNRAALWGYAFFPWLLRSLDRVFDQSEAAVGVDERVLQRPNNSFLGRLARLARVTGVARFNAETLRLAMMLALVFALGRENAFVWAQTMFLVFVGTALTTRWSTSLAVLRHGLGAFLAAGVLLFPWVAQTVNQGLGGWSFIGDDSARTTALRIDELLRLHSSTHGVIGSALLGGIFIVAGIFPLLVADGDRLLLTIRCWTLVVGSVLLAWTAGRGWLPGPVPGPALLLLPAAYGACRAAAEGLGALVGEVRRRGFGWRQGLAGMALISVGLSVIPILSASADGRWGRPLRGPVDKLGWMRRDGGGFRVAFLGDPAVLPGTAVRLGPGLGTVLSRDGVPTIADQWTTPETNRVRAFRDAITTVRAGATTRLGADLAALSIRYLVIVERARSTGPLHAVPADLRQALFEQLDLRAIDSVAGLTVYENDAWVPMVWSPLTSAAGLDPGGSVNTAGASAALAPSPVSSVDPSVVGAQADGSAVAKLLESVRLRPPRSSFDGPVEADSLVIAAVPPSNQWTLHVGRETSKPVELRSLLDAGGVGRTSAPFSGFSVSNAAPRARLAPTRSFGVTVQMVIVSALWILALLMIVRDRHRHRRAQVGADIGDADGEGVSQGEGIDDVFRDDEFADPFPTARRPVPIITTPEDLPADGSVSDELWSRFAERRREESDDQGSAG